MSRNSEANGYKSPLRKLVPFFERSRNQWKRKAIDVKKEAKRLQNRVRFLEKSKSTWREKAKKLAAENARLKKGDNPEEFESRRSRKGAKKNSLVPAVIEVDPSLSVFPKHHHYSVGLITLTVRIVVGASNGIRAGIRVLQTMSEFFRLPQSTPSWSSGRIWLLRVGYYKLTREKETADDWVWIVDHTIQAGSMKCLTILGIRLSWFENQEDRRLCHSDVEPIDLFPVEKSNGEIVYQQLEEAAKKTGIPRQIVGDHGGDLKAGIKRFIAQNTGTIYTHDIKHFTALVLEHEFKDDTHWVNFTKLASETRNFIHQTDISYIEPPSQRFKSRFMNMESLVNWGEKMLSFLDRKSGPIPIESELVRIREKTDWVSQFRESIGEWKAILSLVGKTESFVRTKGLFLGCDKELRTILHLSPSATERMVRIRWTLIEHVLNESLKAEPGERLLGSSEVIESIYGKFKYLENEHARGTLTGYVLAIPAMVAKTTQEVVYRALETVTAKDVRTWIKERFGKSPRAKRKEAFDVLPCAEQKQDQFLLPA